MFKGQSTMEHQLGMILDPILLTVEIRFQASSVGGLGLESGLRSALTIKHDDQSKTSSG